MPRPWLTILLLVLLPAGMLYPLWTDPTSAGEDDVVFFYPVRVLTADALRQGHLPLWNPFSATGTSLMADPQSSVFFPPNWLFVALPAKLAYSLCLFLAFGTAGVGAFVYLRRLGLRDEAGAFGAIVFMFCGFMVGHRVHLGVIQTAGLLPWALLGIELMRPKSVAAVTTLLHTPQQWHPNQRAQWHAGVRRGLAVLAGAMALALAAGHWPTVIQMSLPIGVYLLVRGRPLKFAIPAALAAGVLAGLLMASQIYVTMLGMQATFRAGLAYSTAIENSFFPLSTVLALFPFLLGNRDPNFFSQKWWGPWHQCEMLGYVGLITLILAAAAVLALYRRRQEQQAGPLGPLVRLWVWLGAGAFVWMLGGYLPTYRLMYWLPVLGKVRCPARMVLTLDLALAALSAIGMHWWLIRRDEAWKLTLSKVCIFLAGVMCLLSLGLLMAARTGRLEAMAPVLNVPHSVAQSVQQALEWKSPAFYVPVALLALTVIALGRATGVSPAEKTTAEGGCATKEQKTTAEGGCATKEPDSTSPGATAAESAAVRDSTPANAAGVAPIVSVPGRSDRRLLILLPLLLLDLFILCRFVDVPPPDKRIDPEVSPAAAWLAQHAAGQPFRVWGLSRDYHHRPAELLLPNCSALFGIASISYYGPLQPLEHARMFGFEPWGENCFWQWLIRDNRLLSLFDVRYVLAADPVYRQVIESAQWPLAQPGANLLPAVGEITLQASAANNADVKTWPVTLEDGLYRIDMDIRAPHGADNVFIGGWRPGLGQAWWREFQSRIRLSAEQLTPTWRHVGQLFMGAKEAGLFLLATTSRGAVEIRNVQLREIPAGSGNLESGSGNRESGIGNRESGSGNDMSVGAAASQPGAVATASSGHAGPSAIYHDLTPDGLPAIHSDDLPVHIYENLRVQGPHWRPERVTVEPDSATAMERLRWDEAIDLRRDVLAAAPAEGEFWAQAAPSPKLVSGKTGVKADLLGLVASQPPEPLAASTVVVGLVYVQAAALLTLIAVGLWPKVRRDTRDTQDR